MHVQHVGRVLKPRGGRWPKNNPVHHMKQFGSLAGPLCARKADAARLRDRA